MTRIRYRRSCTLPGLPCASRVGRPISYHDQTRCFPGRSRPNERAAWPWVAAISVRVGDLVDLVFTEGQSMGSAAPLSRASRSVCVPARARSWHTSAENCSARRTAGGLRVPDAASRAASLYIYSTSPPEKGSFAACAVRAEAGASGGSARPHQGKGTIWYGRPRNETRIIWEVL